MFPDKRRNPKERYEIRTFIYFLIATLLCLLVYKQNLFASILTGVVLSTFTFCISYLCGKFAYENQKISVFFAYSVYRIEQGLSLTFIVLGLAIFKDFDVINIAIGTNIFWILGFCASLFYFGLTLFVYKKKIIIAFAVLLASIPIVGTLIFLKDIFDFNQITVKLMTIYSVYIGLLMGVVSFYSYIDESLNKKGGIWKKRWRNLLHRKSFGLIDKVE